MLVVQTITIGDDLPIRAINVTSGRTGQLCPNAVLTYELVEKETRLVIASGNMVRYDEPNASFEAIILAADLVDLVSQSLYTLLITIQNAGSQTIVGQDLTAVLDNLVANKDGVIVPGTFTIGDDLPIRAINIVSGRTGEPLSPNAIVTYELLDILTRVSIAAGPMYRYAAASYEAVILRDKLQQGLVTVEDDYVLHIIILDDGLQTTLAAAIDATTDPISYQH